MNQETKNLLLSIAKKHVEYIRNKITDTLFSLNNSIKTGLQEINKMSRADQMVQEKIIAYQKKKEEGLTNIYPSPYFTRCDVIFENKTKPEVLYFSKFPFLDESIYSWVAPAATLRFEKPGKAFYKLNNGTTQVVKLLRKDQYMIVDGRMVFFTTESEKNARELIHQEHFSNKKAGFILPEIVAQMEQAQDQVVRANYKGPFVISGPAGSGKTTLALHRVAYLAQSPDTAEFFPGNSMIVFVQDKGTKEYFSHLLPELGIHDVTITTFAEWAANILNSDTSYISRIGSSEKEKKNLEWQKIQSLKNQKIPKYSKNHFTLLEQFYNSYFSDSEIKLFQMQKKKNILDRIDLTVLLNSYLETNGRLEITKEYYVKLKTGELKKKTGRFPFEYSLIIIDEFQNYLKEQLNIFKSCANQKYKSIVYVGDMAQQIYLGTVREWKEINETIPNDRHVILQKVYRNTKQILEYIATLGYKIEIPKEAKNGKLVCEKITQTINEEIKYIKNRLSEESLESVGILAKEKDYLLPFKEQINNDKIHFLSMYEAQGVEFDVVFLVGVNQDMFSADETDLDDLKNEENRIQKDLLYVALTRAISELHILGNDKLTNLLK